MTNLQTYVFVNSIIYAIDGKRAEFISARTISVNAKSRDTRSENRACQRALDESIADCKIQFPNSEYAGAHTKSLDGVPMRTPEREAELLEIVLR